MSLTPTQLALLNRVAQAVSTDQASADFATSSEGRVKTVAQSAVISAGFSLVEGAPGKPSAILVSAPGTATPISPPYYVHFYKGNHGGNSRTNGKKLRRCSVDIRAVNFSNGTPTPILYLELQARSACSSQSAVGWQSISDDIARVEYRFAHAFLLSADLTAYLNISSCLLNANHPASPLFPRQPAALSSASATWNGTTYQADFLLTQLKGISRIVVAIYLP